MTKCEVYQATIEKSKHDAAEMPRSMANMEDNSDSEEEKREAKRKNNKEQYKY